MSENKALEMTAEDQNWSRRLKNRVGRQFLRATADAVIANELARAVRDKALWRLEYLLANPLPSLFTRHPSAPGPETAFGDAWQGMSQNARETARYNYPSLYNEYRNTPLGVAVLAGFLEGAQHLLEKGAEPFHRLPANPSGYGGPLGAAIFYGNEEMISLLMKQPAVQKELREKPAFRNYLLLTAVGTDCAATLAHLATCDPDLLEKGRIHGDCKASDFTLGEGIFAYKEKLKARRAFEAAQNPPSSKYGDGPKYRPDTRPKNQPGF